MSHAAARKLETVDPVHARRANAIREAVRRSREDPKWFVRTILRNDRNDPWHDELLEAVWDFFRKREGKPTKVNHEGKNRFSIRSGHGVGKTTGVAELMHALNFTRCCQIICTATKFEQVTTRLWPRFRMLRAGAIDEYQHIMDVTGEKIIWADDPDWCAIPQTATQPENLQGFHPNGPDDYVVFIVDEASGIKQELFPVIEGTLSSGRGILILIGNPTQNQGEFHDSHCKPKVRDLYYTIHVKPENSTHMSAKWVGQMKQRYGENSPIYKIRVAGEFAENSERQLLSLTWLMAALDRVPVDDGSLSKLRIAVDVADGGADETVLDAARMYDTHTHFVKLERHSFPASESPILAADRAEQLFLELKGRKDEDEFVVDSLGVGAGTAGTLMQRGYRVITYKGGEGSDDSDQWKNRRTQSYLVCRDEFRLGRVSFAEDYASQQDVDDMLEQLCWIKTKPGVEKLEELETKQELIRRTLKSPDLADTKAMMYATQLPNTPSSMLLGTLIPIGTMESANAP